MTLRREAIQKDRVVYLLLSNTAMAYDRGRSRIVYIGTTKRGVARLAGSAAEKARDLLGSHGVTQLDVRVLLATPRQRVKTWEVLEAELLNAFESRFGQLPRGNRRRGGSRGEPKVFSPARLKRLIERIGEPPEGGARRGGARRGKA